MGNSAFCRYARSACELQQSHGALCQDITSLWYAVLCAMCCRSGGGWVTYHESRLWSGTVGRLIVSDRTIRDGSPAGALQGVRSWHGGAHGASPHLPLLVGRCVCLRPTARGTAAHRRERTHSPSATGSSRREARAACGGCRGILALR